MASTKYQWLRHARLVTIDEFRANYPHMSYAYYECEPIKDVEAGFDYVVVNAPYGNSDSSYSPVASTRTIVLRAYRTFDEAVQVAERLQKRQDARDMFVWSYYEVWQITRPRPSGHYVVVLVDGDRVSSVWGRCSNSQEAFEVCESLTALNYRELGDSRSYKVIQTLA